jgi:hypothetical protein
MPVHHDTGRPVALEAHRPAPIRRGWLPGYEIVPTLAAFDFWFRGHSSNSSTSLKLIKTVDGYNMPYYLMGLDDKFPSKFFDALENRRGRREVAPWQLLFRMRLSLEVPAS